MSKVSLVELLSDADDVEGVKFLNESLLLNRKTIKKAEQSGKRRRKK